MIHETLKKKLADDLIKSGIVKGWEIINHSYTNESNNPNSRLTLEDYIETKRWYHANTHNKTRYARCSSERWSY